MVRSFTIGGSRTRAAARVGPALASAATKPHQRTPPARGPRRGPVGRRTTDRAARAAMPLAGLEDPASRAHGVNRPSDSRAPAASRCARPVPIRRHRTSGTSGAPAGCRRGRHLDDVPSGIRPRRPTRRAALDADLGARRTARAGPQREARHRRDRSAAPRRETRASRSARGRRRGGSCWSRGARPPAAHRPPLMPSPSSSTRIALAAALDRDAMRRAPASIAFSTSSLMTDAGRSTTSPAAIWFARSGAVNLSMDYTPTKNTT